MLSLLHHCENKLLYKLIDFCGDKLFSSNKRQNMHQHCRLLLPKQDRAELGEVRTVDFQYESIWLLLKS